MFLSGDSQEDTNGASSSSFSFLLRWIQFKFSGLITFLSLFQMLSHVGASLNHPPPAIYVIWSAEDISEDSHFHSQSVQAISRLLSHSSRLIQPVLSPFQVIVQRCIFWVGPNPQVFSQDLTSPFLFSRSYSQIHFKVWRKNELSPVKCLSPRSFKLFSSLVQPF